MLKSYDFLSDTESQVVGPVPCACGCGPDVQMSVHSRNKHIIHHHMSSAEVRDLQCCVRYSTLCGRDLFCVHFHILQKVHYP